MVTADKFIKIHKRMQNDKVFEATENMGAHSSPNFAFILSLVGGLVIVLLSVVLVFLLISGSPYATLYGIELGMMRVFGFDQGWLVVFSIAAVVCGTFVVAGAILLNARPAKHFAWGITVLVFSVASFIGGGGLFIGALLGMLGGFLAIITSKSSGVFISPRILPKAN
jgi:hypothetical protein